LQRRRHRRAEGARDERTVERTGVPEHTDEATIRHTAEAQLGGTSSSESRDAYLRGDNPGGLHRGGHGPEPRKHGSDGDEAADEPNPEKPM
jgi:hypothetical protein